MPADTEDCLRRLVADHLAVDPIVVLADAKLVEYLHADSLDQVELVMATEEEFDTTVDDEDAEQVVTFGEMLALTEKLLDA